MYTPQLPAEPDSLLTSNDQLLSSPATNIFAEMRAYIALLHEVAELGKRGLICSGDQESIKESVLKNVHQRLSPGAHTGRMRVRQHPCFSPRSPKRT